MDKETLKALKESIAKWERNAVSVEHGDVKISANDCPLCREFIVNSNRHDDEDQELDIDCRKCPVMQKTGKFTCEGTPYGAAYRAWALWGHATKEQREAFHAAARAEVEFLKSLLPEWEK